jgi:hypothetical protein
MLFYGIAFFVVFGAITTFVFSACTGGTMDSGDWDWKNCTGKDDTDTDTDTDTDDDDDNSDMYDGKGDLFKQAEKLEVSGAFDNLKIGDQFTCKKNFPEYKTGVSRRDGSNDGFGELDKFRKSSHLGYAQYLPTDVIAGSWTEKDTKLGILDNCANITLLKDKFQRVYTHNEMAQYYDPYDRIATWETKAIEEWDKYTTSSDGLNKDEYGNLAPINKDQYIDETYMVMTEIGSWIFEPTDEAWKVINDDFTDLVFNYASTKTVNNVKSFLCILHNWKKHTRPVTTPGAEDSGETYIGYSSLIFKQDTDILTVFYSELFVNEQHLINDEDTGYDDKKLYCIKAEWSSGYENIDLMTGTYTLCEQTKDSHGNYSDKVPVANTIIVFDPIIGRLTGDGSNWPGGEKDDKVYIYEGDDVFKEFNHLTDLPMQNNSICKSVYNSLDINNNTKSCAKSELGGFETCWNDALKSSNKCADKKDCCNQYSTPYESQKCLQFGSTMYPQGCVDPNSCYEQKFESPQYTLAYKESCIKAYGV